MFPIPNITTNNIFDIPETWIRYQKVGLLDTSIDLDLH